jgi:N-dimethylarginine dimethylaminohydrolase
MLLGIREMASVPRILMCPPDFFGIEYEINPWMKVEVGSNPDRAARQWRLLRETLLELGVTVELIEPVPGLPDLVFTANAGLTYENLFLVSRFRFGVRQGEAVYFEQWARGRGLEVETLPEGYNFEGAGDALFCGDTLFAGYRFRSDVRSHQWIGERLGLPVLPLELVDPRFYHLDTCFCPLDLDLAMYYPGAFDEYGRTVLRDRIPHLIDVAPEEAISFSCNAVVVGRTVILNEGAPKLARMLRDRGFAVRALGFDEFIKSGGSAKCLTLRIDGEEAAIWKRTARAGQGQPRGQGQETKR